jgi:hypothetical protein
MAFAPRCPRRLAKMIEKPTIRIIVARYFEP